MRGDIIFILHIKEYRVASCMSQSELSKMSGISQSYISRLENNDFFHKSPTLNVLEQIAIALQITPMLLLSYEED